MVVHDLYFRRAGTPLRPLEADSPLIIDADAPLPFASALERLQTIAGHRQVTRTGRCIKLVELSRGGTGNPREGGDPATLVERFGLLVRKTDDHNAFVPDVTASVSY